MTNFELLSMNESLMRFLCENHINVNDVRNLEIYREFERMKKEGHKVSYIAVNVAERFGLTDRGVYKIVKRLGQTIGSTSTNGEPGQ